MEQLTSSIWYDGTGVPEETIGTNGDYYIQIEKWDIYKKTYDTWIRIGNIKGAPGETGAQGPNGLNGRDGLHGEDGLNGSSWIDGASEPSKLVGRVGDYYLNTSNSDIFKKSTQTNWERIGNISGNRGPAGYVDEEMYNELLKRITLLEGKTSKKKVETKSGEMIIGSYNGSIDGLTLVNKNTFSIAEIVLGDYGIPSGYRYPITIDNGRDLESPEYISNKIVLTTNLDLISLPSGQFRDKIVQQEDGTFVGIKKISRMDGMTYYRSGSVLPMSIYKGSTVQVSNTDFYVFGVDDTNTLRAVLYYHTPDNGGTTRVTEKASYSLSGSQERIETILIENSIYIQTGALKALLKYDIATSSFELTNISCALPGPMFYNSGNIIFMDGWGMRDEKVEFYNLETGERRYGSHPYSSKISLSFSAMVNNKIYIIGGDYEDEDNKGSLVQIYNIDEDSWSLGARMPEPLFNGATGFDKEAGKIYCMGGLSPQNWINNVKNNFKIYCFNIEENSWTIETSPDSIPNYSYLCGAIKDPNQRSRKGFLIFGGENSSCLASNCISKYEVLDVEINDIPEEIPVSVESGSVSNLKSFNHVTRVSTNLEKGVMDFYAIMEVYN